MEDKALATDLTYDRQQLLSQKHLMVVCAIDLHSKIDEYQVYSLSLDIRMLGLCKSCNRNR